MMKRFKFVVLENIFKPYFRHSAMIKPETLEDYYAKRPFLKTSDLKKEEGHFNILSISRKNQPEHHHPVSYSRKEYFKICLISGKSQIHYADKSFEIQKHGLLFANPLIPYNWEPIDGLQSGYSCIFTESFFNNFGDIKKYPFFQPGGYPVYELSTSELLYLENIFVQMKHEKDSDFEYKDDVLRNLVFQLIHSALKMRPSENILPEKQNSAARITSLFIDLLESQFPISSASGAITLRSASDFAGQMSVHVNHLNKSVKEAMSRTTSEMISERILKEAKILLKHSSWAISEIAYALGFEGPSHFSTFFRKHLKLSPSQFRNPEKF
ncbi:helix-turn-helix transcriptional regulator [Chryseobacterium fluminis]|uniref:helix-turn-helix domain-containing protein n=1 Tax=Chryseobacterium fluminis TaxID=2983606 RepID=UPI002256FF4D|nr:AraC family transcriptional regulator [Chryseobacterium sp. MMS21-Ot14]UZT99199.1 helix-turn-helix transcriptional regulator [Chryseobacterium sp. MMS21-Ot14]